ncbi:hypothetical protein [Candidatus Enterococcus clewellii]|uniref:DUF3899 domain-containing protein n=1 Tax=Candidatus Enterococcus clewellii TaxID=1834193 RepID=A0A242KEJ1_9ENTE|nr:hypothetical protein [Enterococcus sp. 9E7_DIV0242]OTP19376.1 hypothetical protein A5888_001193 [Enterococcus sp. 9E7_DIV0242]
MTLDTIRFLTTIGFVSTGIVLLLALLIKYVTSGLFLSRTPQRFIQDKENPYYANERKFGYAFSSWALHYIPALCLACLILLLFSFIVG